MVSDGDIATLAHPNLCGSKYLIRSSGKWSVAVIKHPSQTRPCVLELNRTLPPFCQGYFFIRSSKMEKGRTQLWEKRERKVTRDSVSEKKWITRYWENTIVRNKLLREHNWVKIERFFLKKSHRILVSSVSECASLATAVITDGLATLATVMLQQN